MKTAQRTIAILSLVGIAIGGGSYGCSGATISDITQDAGKKTDAKTNADATATAPDGEADATSDGAGPDASDGSIAFDASDASNDVNIVPDAKGDAAKDSATTNPGSLCASATPVAYSTAEFGAISTSGKAFLYAVKVTAGDFIVLSASTSATGDVVDTALSIYDTTGTTLLANNDDGYPRTTTDAVIFYRAPTTTTLCVRVTDFDTWKGTLSTVATDSNFTFYAAVVSSTLETVTLDQETNDTIAAPQTGKLKAFTSDVGGYTTLVGTIGTSSDVDVFKFTVPTSATSLTVNVPPIGAPLVAGEPSYGSTMARFAVTVKKADGTIVSELAPPIGQIEKMSDSLTVPVSAGDYYVILSRPGGVATGTNDFYAATLSFAKGNPTESEAYGAHTNDLIATPEAVTMTTDTANSKLKHGYLLGYLPAGDIADNFSFAVKSGDVVSIACGASRNGSGLQSFKVDLLVGGVSKQSEVESTTADVAWSSGAAASKAPLTIASAGTAVLQLSAGSRSVTNTGTYYLCGVHVTSL